MTVCKVMPSSTGFYLILLVHFFSLFIEGFHLDPLPEPLGSYMSGKNYNLFIKQEGVCFINSMHFYCSRWQNVFQITSVYTTAKTKNKTKYKKKANKQNEIWKCRDKMTWSHPTIRAFFCLLNYSAEKEVQPESLQVFEVAAAWTCFLLSKWFLGCTHPLIDKQMVISEPSVLSA